jgi:hypothetical protein
MSGRSFSAPGSVYGLDGFLGSRRSLGPVVVRTEDSLATVTCSLYGTRSLVAVASDEAFAFG